MATIQALIEEGSRRLRSLPESRLEARLLLLAAAGLPEESFFRSPEALVPRRAENAFFRLVSRRREGFPLSYLTGSKEFWSLRLAVSRAVLIPRPETELIVEKALELAPAPRPVILDMGTGSGNIAIALAKELPESRIYAADCSLRALKIAAANARRHQAPNIRFVPSRLFSAFERGRRRFDVIVSNPPYVSEEEWKNLPAEIREHEPRRALVPGPTGFEFIRALVRKAPAFLRRGGWLILETGAGQAEKALSFFDGRWRLTDFARDLAGIPRVVYGRRD
ncbi:MAG: peptide chain release factor N(5)-glutamine methyltransferase [Acidobacteriota bacterium]|nr:peptide chain release factor N(5)-glutamine methyltransferase [Acidobacteriota bacterium]